MKIKQIKIEPLSLQHDWEWILDKLESHWVSYNLVKINKKIQDKFPSVSVHFWGGGGNERWDLCFRHDMKTYQTTLQTTKSPESWGDTRGWNNYYLTHQEVLDVLEEDPFIFAKEVLAKVGIALAKKLTKDKNYSILIEDGRRYLVKLV